VAAAPAATATPVATGREEPTDADAEPEKPGQDPKGRRSLAAEVAGEREGVEVSAPPAGNRAVQQEARSPAYPPPAAGEAP
jgi:hypothetical protein